jgi:hypothetical protein
VIGVIGVLIGGVAQEIKLPGMSVTRRRCLQLNEIKQHGVF